jgi:hypothetical protein
MVVVGGLFAANTAVNADDVERDIGGEAKHHHGYTFTPINVPFPGVGETAAIGINRGQIVGFYTDGTGQHGFINDKGRFSPIDVPFPGVIGTELHGINNRSQIVGLYTTSGGQEHGFFDNRGVLSWTPKLGQLAKVEPCP